MEIRMEERRRRRRAMERAYALSDTLQSNAWILEIYGNAVGMKWKRFNGSYHHKAPKRWIY